MKEYHPKVVSVVAFIFRLMAVLYFAVSFVLFFVFSNPGEGDESLFMSDLKIIQTNGWTTAIEKSISIPYMILSYPFSFFMESHMALRTVNLLLTILLLIYFLKIAKIKSADFYFYFLFYAATSSVFFKGTNDTLFFFGLIVFLNEVFYFIENKKMNSIAIAFSGLVVSFFTREIFMVYLPAVMLGIYFLYRNGFKFMTSKILLPVILFIFFLVLNIPSIQKNRKLSFDQKEPPKEMNVTWAQRQYLAQLMVNKGELQNLKHPSWETTRAYLREHGPNSLPETTFESLTFDYRLTISEFFKDFYYSIFFGFRQLGLMLFVPLFFIVMNIRKGKFLVSEMFVPLAAWLMISIFSLIIISYIELRWLIAVFVALIVFYDYCRKQKRIGNLVVIANYCILICFSVYGIYKLLPKLAESLLS